MVVHEYIIERAEKIAEVVEGLSDIEIFAVFRTYWENHSSKPKVKQDEVS